MLSISFEMVCNSYSFVELSEDNKCRKPLPHRSGQLHPLFTLYSVYMDVRYFLAFKTFCGLLDNISSLFTVQYFYYGTNKVSFHNSLVIFIFPYKLMDFFVSVCVKMLKLYNTANGIRCFKCSQHYQHGPNMI